MQPDISKFVALFDSWGHPLMGEYLREQLCELLEQDRTAAYDAGRAAAAARVAALEAAVMVLVIEINDCRRRQDALPSASGQDEFLMTHYRACTNDNPTAHAAIEAAMKGEK